jgi:hypothetical protein
MAEPEELLPGVTTRETVADDVRAAFEQHAEAIGDKLANSTTDETAAAKAERLRDERGQFVAKDKTVEQVAPITKITDADRREEQATQPSSAAGPPTSWSADAKAAWSTLPPAIQQAAIKRENEANEGQRQWSEQRRSYEQALGPISELAQEYQMPVGDAIERLVNVERRLKTPEAPQVIQELAQAYGVNLAALVNGSQQPQPTQASQALDPNQLFRQLDQRFDQRFQEAEAKRQQEAETNSIISDFVGEKDQSGQPVHPHFESVKQLMGHLLNSGQADSMQDAYEKAVWATPATRQAMMEVQSKASPVDAEKQRTAKARKAAVSLNGAPSTGAAASNLRQVNGNSVADDVRAAWNAQVSS